MLDMLISHLKLILKGLIALKKGTQLIKYSRKGKPKFCPFRLSSVIDCVTSELHTSHLTSIKVYVNLTCILHCRITFSITTLI